VREAAEAPATVEAAGVGFVTGFAAGCADPAAAGRFFSEPPWRSCCSLITIYARKKKTQIAMKHKHGNARD
jgi:hypothetical protein